MRLNTIFLLIFILCHNLNAQYRMNLPGSAGNNIPTGPITFTPQTASEYISDLLKKNNLWGPYGDTMRLALGRLIDHYNEPFDSVSSRLLRFHHNSVKYKQINHVNYEIIPIRWLNDSTFIIDTLPLSRNPLIVKKTPSVKAADTLSPENKDKLPVSESLADAMLQKKDSMKSIPDAFPSLQETGLQEELTLLQKMDTISETIIDTAYLGSNNIQLRRYVNQRFIPSFFPYGSKKSASLLPDSKQLVISDTTKAVAATAGSSFYVVPGEKMADSLRIAVKTILSYTYDRDSILVYFSDIRGQKTPFWLTGKNEEFYRYWVRNYKNDSITIWLGNPSKKEIALILEEYVNVNRLQKEAAKDIPISESTPARTLAKVQLLKEIPVYWDYDLAGSIAMSQTFFSNWANGGDNSFTSVLDITGGANYTNKEAKTRWTNGTRLKYGTIITGEHGLRTNTDLLEFNSQYNKVIRAKMDISTVFYMKTQVAKGFNYPNDSIPVSKFLNPGAYTIGVGLEYKPFKMARLNFSPLSYRNTFVLDTTSIDQTLHGIEADKKTHQEMGCQLVVKTTNNLFDGLIMSHSLRLFSSYLNNPQNIDVDWEINLDKQINWFFKIQLNIHMIYDDDIRFPVIDDNDEPVFLPDGKPKKSPKMQLKQYLGLTMAFKF